MLENNSKLAIVKGASRGVGYATSLALSKSRIRVVVEARRMDILQEIKEQTVKVVKEEEEKEKYF